MPIELKRSPVYTLGTSTRSPEEFVELLKHHSIKEVVDVRRYPGSRFEHFRKENLARLLRNNSIDYIPLGEYLGGHRKGGYEAFMKTETFREGIARLEEIATGATTAIICAERLPQKCHRRFIASELKSRGREVFHIIDADNSLNEQTRLLL
ncbi:MAG: DUF488 domain-containing protein [Dehalococcoidia bacterium]